MELLEAGAWGLCGGAAAGLVALGAATTAAGFRWPWSGNADGPWPRFCVYASGVIIGTVVAAAAHPEMTGPLPALLMGVGAPSVIRGAIARVEVSETKPAGEQVAILAPAEHDHNA
jgi:hypothetical protein